MGCSMAHLELRKKDPPTIQVIRKLANFILTRVITKKCVDPGIPIVTIIIIKNYIPNT